MNERDPHTELERLEAEHPGLMALLKNTPAPPEADAAEKASPDELLAARAYFILATASDHSRSREQKDIVLSHDGLRVLIGALSDMADKHHAQIVELQQEIAELRRDGITADGVRVITAKVVASMIIGLAALVAIVGGVIKLT